ncbi:MAG: acetaldehyde dehydrogenase (acetylating) [Candidatus Aquirickettsiella gammari]|uniref:Acetaldehyde dehydrogenase n=1 Tax=Candidatus Aquirickettsiella gammari TaxID=2016198 RepID=A0A370CLF1_9COXI|nr:MAG: acetaldehyde dehydrogenase (acetylating) [Candidatus Aquirickettsiella gammari]
MKVAILGSGNIGTDLLIKILRSSYLECSAFIGRNLLSKGIQKARTLDVNTSTLGIQYIQENPNCCEIVFDATSAAAHKLHAPVLKELNKFTIDLTPAKNGKMCIPVINIDESLHCQNVNMVTCGGQATLPIIYALANSGAKIQYIEVVSSIASSSAGPATRDNLDEYIHTTEYAIRLFSGAPEAKAILNLNPAQPCINMQTTIFSKVTKLNMESFCKAVTKVELAVQRYVPGYKVLLNPLIENNRIIVIVQVKGQGDYLPAYAGNLDIINCAALAIAEKYAISKLNMESLCVRS